MNIKVQLEYYETRYSSNITSGMVLQLLEGAKIIIADNRVDQDRELD